jgi:hypothetical protein
MVRRFGSASFVPTRIKRFYVWFYGRKCVFVAECAAATFADAQHMPVAIGRNCRSTRDECTGTL